MSYGIQDEKNLRNKAQAGWGMPMRATKHHWFDQGKSNSICDRWQYQGQRFQFQRVTEIEFCQYCVMRLERRKAP